MKAVVISNGRLEIRNDLEIPKITDGEILVKMKACGLCGTDIEKIKGEYTASQPILGHEPVGIVAESKVDWIREGDRVFAHHHVPCYNCYYCKKGSPTMCEYYRKTNIYPGGFSEYFRVPAWNIERGGVLKLPQNVTFEDGIFIEPLATVIRAQRRVRIEEGDTVLIIGAGPMGLLHALLARVYRANMIIASDVSDYRLNFALEHKIIDYAINPNSTDIVSEVRKLSDGRGADVVIIATGNPKGILQGLYSTRKGGRVLLFGVPYKGSKLDYDISDLLNNEISIISSNAAVEEDTNEALRLISQEKINVRQLITHKFRIEEFYNAIRVAEEGKAIKVIIYD
ncbi:MAG: zinc-dependent dehydrogenase [Sulfolobaceae archaeon]